VAFLASVLGGLSGFGTGLALPAFLAPVVGIEHVVPVMAIAMLLNNGGRVVAFRNDIDRTHVRRVLTFGLPMCLLGAYTYTRLDARTIALVLGSFLLLSIPIRRLLQRADRVLPPRAELVAGGAFGYLNGGLTGTGVLLISLLMSAGVSGAGLIATDAAVSAILNASKAMLFGGFAALDRRLALIGLLVGLCTVPSGFIARRLLQHIPARIHAWIMEVVILIGGLWILAEAGRP
jgi:uncharacterized membrane protein YfcA